MDEKEVLRRYRNFRILIGFMFWLDNIVFTFSLRLAGKIDHLRSSWIAYEHRAKETV